MNSLNKMDEISDMRQKIHKDVIDFKLMIFKASCPFERPTCSSYIHNVHFCFYSFTCLFLFYTFYTFIYKYLFFIDIFL